MITPTKHGQKVLESLDVFMTINQGDNEVCNVFKGHVAYAVEKHPTEFGAYVKCVALRGRDQALEYIEQDKIREAHNLFVMALGAFQDVPPIVKFYESLLVDFEALCAIDEIIRILKGDDA